MASSLAELVRSLSVSCGGHPKDYLTQRQGPALTNLANNFSGLFLLLMFYEASEKTASDSSSSMSGHAWMPMLMLLALLFVGQWAIAEIGTSESLRIPFVFELILGGHYRSFYGTCLFHG